jgi:hypothetical protein
MENFIQINQLGNLGLDGKLIAYKTICDVDVEVPQCHRHSSECDPTCITDRTKK